MKEDKKFFDRIRKGSILEYDIQETYRTKLKFDEDGTFSRADDDDGMTIAEINKVLSKRFSGQRTIDNAEIWTVYSSLFERTYSKEFKQVELDETYTSNDALNKMLRQLFYKFNVQDGIVNGEISQEQVSKLELQRKFIKSVIDSLSMTGCLGELIDKENENIKFLNGFLPQDSAIEFIPYKPEDIYEKLDSFDLTKQEDVINLYTYGRHFTNKLAHNYIDYAYAILKINSMDDNTYANGRALELEKYLTKLYEIIGDGSRKINEELLEDYLTAMVPQKKERKQLIQTVKGFFKDEQKREDAVSEAKKCLRRIISSKKYFGENRVYKYENMTEYFYELVNRLRVTKKRYDDIVAQNTGNAKLKPDSFETFFSSILDGTIEEDFYKEFKRVEKNGDSKPKTINMIDELQGLIIKTEEDCFITGHEDEILKKIVGILGKVDELFSAKQFFSDALLEIGKEHPELISLEHNLEHGEKRTAAGVFDMILPGRTQIFGGHYKDGEFDPTDPRIVGLPGVSDKVSACFSTTDENAFSLNVFIPMLENLTEEQIDVFKNLLKTMNHLDGNLPLTEEQSKELFGYEKLKALKTSSAESYESLKVRVALGAGIEQYKERYEIAPQISTEQSQNESTKKDEQKVSIVKPLTTFQKNTAELILSEVSSGRSLQDVINDIGTINDEILEYVQSKIKEENFFQNPTDEVDNEVSKLGGQLEQEESQKE